MRVRHVRRQAGLTQEQLASITGLSDGYISHLEKNQRTPSRSAIKVLSSALGVNEEWLATGKESSRTKEAHHRKETLLDLPLEIQRRLAQLPPRLQRRYRVRVGEIVEAAKRQLEEALKALESDYRDTKE